MSACVPVRWYVTSRALPSAAWSAEDEVVRAIGRRRDGELRAGRGADGGDDCRGHVILGRSRDLVELRLIEYVEIRRGRDAGTARHRVEAQVQRLAGREIRHIELQPTARDRPGHGKPGDGVPLGVEVHGVPADAERAPGALLGGGREERLNRWVLRHREDRLIAIERDGRSARLLAFEHGLAGRDGDGVDLVEKRRSRSNRRGRRMDLAGDRRVQLVEHIERRRRVDAGRRGGIRGHSHRLVQRRRIAHQIDTNRHVRRAVGGVLEGEARERGRDVRPVEGLPEQVGEHGREVIGGAVSEQEGVCHRGLQPGRARVRCVRRKSHAGRELASLRAGWARVGHIARQPVVRGARAARRHGRDGCRASQSPPLRPPRRRIRPGNGRGLAHGQERALRAKGVVNPEKLRTRIAEVHDVANPWPPQE